MSRDEHQDPDFVEVYLNDDGTVSHVWVHFVDEWMGESRGRYVEVPARTFEAQW
ncbi:MAG: hypothetical protein V4510_13075 [bacterium]